jgi:hypothetical protein
MVVLIAGGVVAAVVVFVVLPSGARFTEATESPGSGLSTGEANLEVSPAGQIVNADAMKAGDIRTGDVTVTNRGSRAQLSVTVMGASSAPTLAAAIKLKITDRDAPAVERYNGPLGAAGRIELGLYDKDAAGAWKIQLSLPSGADAALSGTRLDASFEWQARTP